MLMKESKVTDVSVCAFICVCVCVCVCVGGGGLVFWASLFQILLNLTLFSLSLLVFVHMVSFDGITHLLPRLALYPCRGLAPLSE